METLYAVSTGEYSDYRVRAIFTTRELAEQHIAALEANNEWPNGVEEYVLFDRLPERAYEYRARIMPDGALQEWSYPEWEYEHESDAPREGVRTDTTSVVWARAMSPERALKMVQDEVARRKAEAAGIT
jgi:hypothetical protein